MVRLPAMSLSCLLPPSPAQHAAVTLTSLPILNQVSDIPPKPDVPGNLQISRAYKTLIFLTQRLSQAHLG